MDKEEEIEFTEELISDVEELVNDIWTTVSNRFGEDLSQEDMNNLYAALGVVAGMGLTDAYQVDPLFPFHLQGVMTDFTYQTLFSSRYGIDFSALEELKEKCH